MSVFPLGIIVSKKKSPLKISPLTFGLPCVGVDTHAHLDSKEFRHDLPAVLEQARQAGVARVGHVFLGPEEYYAGRELFAEYPQVFFILGLHPCDGQRCTPAALEAMRHALGQDARIKAVGEIGLDYYWDTCPHPLQREAFVAQLALARALGKPVVIHSREATEATLELLLAEGFAHYPLLWHCFGGDVALMQRLMSYGWHISIPGPVGYPANTALREVARTVPLDRLLLETDCPYLSPLEWRGRRNEPALSVFTAACIAHERGMAVAELWEHCGKNSVRFFGLEC